MIIKAILGGLFVVFVKAIFATAIEMRAHQREKDDAATRHSSLYNYENLM